MPDFLRSSSTQEDSVLGDMDEWTRLSVEKLVPPLLASEPVTDSQLAQPVDAGKQATITLLKTANGTEFNNLETDYSCGRFPLGQWIKLKFIQSALDIQDIHFNIGEDDVNPLLEQTQLNKVLPEPTVPFDDPASDAGLTRQAFYGLGSHQVAQVDPTTDKDAPDMACFKLDLMAMNKYKVRNGFAVYGACAYFKQDQSPLAIRTAKGNLVYPTDGYKWEVAKFAWRSSLITLVTAVDHLYGVHFAVAGQMLRASTEALPASHPIKRALQPFLMRTALINNKAGTALLPKHSILHHITSLTWESLDQLADDMYLKGPEWQPLPSYVESKGRKVQELVEQGKLPFYEDGLELYQCFTKFFETVVPATEDMLAKDEAIQDFWKLLQEYTKSKDLGPLTRDTLIATLAHFSFSVTAKHQQVGSIREHMDTPVHGGFRFGHNAVQVDKQSYLGGLVLLAMTSIATPPLLSEFSNFWEDGEEKKRWASLQADLRDLANRIHQRNTTRAYRFQAANPDILECSVSV